LQLLIQHVRIKDHHYTLRQLVQSYKQVVNLSEIKSLKQLNSSFVEKKKNSSSKN